MNDSDTVIIIDWLGMTSPKGIMECTEITASREEIQGFLDQVHTELIEQHAPPSENKNERQRLMDNK